MDFIRYMIFHVSGMDIFQISFAVGHPLSKEEVPFVEDAPYAIEELYRFPNRTRACY